MKLLLSAALLGLVFLSPMAASAHGKGKHDHDRHDHHDRHDDDDHGHDRGRHRGHHKDYRRGVVYVERRIYVDDYPRYELHAPPPGHRWVRSDDGKYVLIAVATGIIADVILHH